MPDGAKEELLVVVSEQERGKELDQGGGGYWVTETPTPPFLRPWLPWKVEGGGLGRIAGRHVGAGHHLDPHRGAPFYNGLNPIWGGQSQRVVWGRFMLCLMAIDLWGDRGFDLTPLILFKIYMKPLAEVLEVWVVMSPICGWHPTLPFFST